ncbi:hypothetical protein FLW53_23470 [Microbispora sp. SCL1-1]|uniref:hypothetical protein n=1 Tax=unclassified Microbispora TaxID=2614687 RepID=UPI00115802BB|nr:MULTISPECIES: hypothetical protein [unclassified Microbispora]NJP27105.1 hypothetical protein [Microbispora sp. CL1-1]TQS11450.1 hypothetical protein FLW53_23470 [Microbispora sp. SCL1-1]
MTRKYVRVKWNGDRIRKAERAAAARGLRRAVDHLKGEAVAIAPIEYGSLTETATASVDEAKLTGAVSFYGDYAVREHENLELKHDPGRQAKYLEQPMNTERAAMLGMVADELRKGLP